jgi:hypothetical protein
MNRTAALVHLRRALTILLFVTAACAVSGAAEAPKFVEKDGRWALMVDGQPYLMLGGQVHNSSAWPSELPKVWKALAELHANTVEAPVCGGRLSHSRANSIGTMSICW